MPQSVPLHVAAPLAAGAGHEVQRVPHDATLPLLTQRPPHTCVLGSLQPPSHGMLSSMQLPWQFCLPAGHAGTQRVPSHVTVPPTGAWHGVQLVVPQELTLAFDTQVPLHEWCPLLHAI